MSEKTYTIKEVAEMLEIPSSTIRYYDTQGLLPFLEKKENGYRIFREKDITMLKVIECFKSTGMSIAEMKEFVELVKQGDASLKERYALFLRRKEMVQKQMEELQKQMDIIEYKLQYYKEALEAGTESIHSMHFDCRK